MDHNDPQRYRHQVVADEKKLMDIKEEEHKVAMRAACKVNNDLELTKKSGLAGKAVT